MASIIKNQILKHLSAFARNLTPDQISVEVLRGKGELRNIELNEAVLTQKLELPPWLKIKRAVCNKVTVKVPWTKLKSSPVELYVDEISVVIQLLSSAPTDFRKTASAMAGKSYDLAERVVEGMSLFVLTVDILFESDSFGGSLMFSKLAVESKNRHTWKDEKNLHMTRVHDKQIRQVLFFKQVSWQLLRIEASAHNKPGANGSEGLNGQRRNAINSPLRLITGDGKCRIAIKKDDMTCAMIDGRIEVILEDILWVATLLQVRSAIDFYKHIKDLANAVRKETEKNPFLINNPNQLQRAPLLTPSTRIAVPENEVSKVFKQLDIHQSSHHLHIGKIVLHLFDDSADHALPENWNTDCGAIQATLYQLSIDYYPAHSVFVDGEFSGRSQWLRYNSPNSFTALASRQLEQHFKLISSNMESTVTERFSRLWPQLNSQNAVIRIKDIVVQCVSEQSTKKEALLDMFCQDKEAKQSIPSTVSFVHLEFTSYFFPASDAYPLPPDSTHLVIGPFEYLVDHRSIRWLVYVYENILNAFEAPQVVPDESELFRPDFRVELIRPKVILTAHEDALDNDPRLPKRFLLNFTKIQCSNFTLINDPALELPIMFKGIGRESLDFVSNSESTLLNVGMREHLLEKSQPINRDGGILKPRSAHNQWFITVPAVWLSCDFGKSKGFETVLVNDICLAGCVVQRSNHIAAMLEPQNTVGVVLDHFQFVQLLQMHTKIVELLDQIDLDRLFFAKNLKHLPASTPIALYGLINKVHIRLVLPPGPTPSPYDLNWTKYGIPASATSTSLSSDLPNDDSSRIMGNAAEETAGDPLAAIETSSKTIPSYNNSSSALESSTPPPFYSVSSIAIAETAAETVNALGGQTENRTPSMVALAPIQEFHPSKKQISNFPDFSNILNQTTDFDTTSTMDETMSVTTTTSDYDRQYLLVDCAAGDDDIFTNSEIVVAEEASLVDEQDNLRKQKEKFLNKEVNVFEVILDSTNVFLASNHEAHSSKRGEPNTTVVGFADCLTIDESLKLLCRDVYGDNGKIPPNNLNGLKDTNTTKQASPQLRFEILSKTLETSINVNINGTDICLSDEVVSKLAPFVENNAEEEKPPSLEIALENCRIEIKDPKKKFPLRIRLGDLKVYDGPESTL